MLNTVPFIVILKLARNLREIIKWSRWYIRVQYIAQVVRLSEFDPARFDPAGHRWLRNTSLSLFIQHTKNVTVDDSVEDRYQRVIYSI